MGILYYVILYNNFNQFTINSFIFVLNCDKIHIYTIFLNYMTCYTKPIIYFELN